ncbi:MAG: hypothetical protein ACHP8A_17750 [Terriglobales bacterium]
MHERPASAIVSGRNGWVAATQHPYKNSVGGFPSEIKDSMANSDCISSPLRVESGFVLWESSDLLSTVSPTQVVVRGNFAAVELPTSLGAAHLPPVQSDSSGGRRVVG